MKVGIAGCAGRMGMMLVRQVAAAPNCTLVSAVERPNSPTLGQDAGKVANIDPLGVSISDDASFLFKVADVVIDFTTPTATANFAKLAAEARAAYIVGTTGLDKPTQAILSQAARFTVVIQAPNMSVGVNLMFSLVERTARHLGEAFDIEIMEIHHRQKVDCPSGTALALGRAAATGRGVDFETHSRKSIDRSIEQRSSGEIGFAVLRGGDIVGDHTVIFAGSNERIEITHRAHSREIFALGAMKAAEWSLNKPPGLYSMNDVLGL
jgi:4-hydroxy-tetrahydrodipicolinate reductase